MHTEWPLTEGRIDDSTIARAELYDINVLSTQLVHFGVNASYSLMFRLPRSLGPQIAPTGADLRPRGSRAVYPTVSFR